MSSIAIYAFFIQPIVLVALAGGAAWLHMRNLRRHNEQHPAE